MKVKVKLRVIPKKKHSLQESNDDKHGACNVNMNRCNIKKEEENGNEKDTNKLNY